MRHITSFLIVCACGLSASSMTENELITALTSFDCKEAKVRYDVLLPSAADPVTYDIELLAVNPGDEYSDCCYLIDWTLPRGNNVSKGFSSYYAGDHFRYRDTRLQEYHVAEDVTPFLTDGGGVARNAQFADLLPAFIASTIQKMQSDSTYSYTFSPDKSTLSGVRRVNGYDALEFTYTFDSATGLPVELDFVYNPASISEQFITATYTWEDSRTPCPVIDEEFLVEHYPEIFEKYRTSNFRVENMSGNPMPTFSFITAESGRINHSRGEADLASPLLMVFVDPAVATTNSVIETVREALASMTYSVIGVYVFNDGITPEVFTATDGEAVATGGRGLVSKCGVTAYPTFLFVNRDGTVASVIQGTSNDLLTALTQSMILLQ